MRQLLVPIDPANSGRTRSAVAEVVRIYREETVSVHLLRVQPRVSGHVAMFFGKQELQQLQQDEGKDALHYAESLLIAAGVPYRTTVLVGRSAETIAKAARDLGCDRVIFGQDGPSFAGKVFGSLAEQVRTLLAPGEAQVIGS